MRDKNNDDLEYSKSTKDITTKYVDKLFIECLVKYNQHVSKCNCNNNDTKKLSAARDLDSIRGSSRVRKPIDDAKQCAFNNTNKTNGTALNNQRLKTQICSYKRFLHSFNNYYQDNDFYNKSMTQSKQNKIVLDKKSKAVYKLFLQNQNDGLIIQTEPNKIENHHLFLRTYNPSSWKKRQFSSTPSVSFARKLPSRQNCFSSNLRSNPNLVSYYRQMDNKKKQNPFYQKDQNFNSCSEMNKEYYHTQSNFFRPYNYNPTTDFRHMRFHNKFIEINNQRNSASVTRDIQRNPEESRDNNNSSNNHSNHNNSNMFSITMPNKMYHHKDSSFNKFIFLTSNNSTSRTKKNLIYKFIKQREKRLKTNYR